MSHRFQKYLVLSLIITGPFPLTVFTCDDGYYSAATATTCLPCPGGYDCTNKAITPVECAQGSYASNASLGCTTCPAGYSCPDAGMIEPVACPAGWYQTATGQQSCTECGQGVWVVVCVCVSVCLCACVCMYVWVWVYAHVCVCVCLLTLFLSCACMHMFVYMCFLSLSFPLCLSHSQCLYCLCLTCVCVSLCMCCEKLLEFRYWSIRKLNAMCKLTSHFGYCAKTLHNRTCNVFLMKKGLGEVIERTFP